MQTNINACTHIRVNTDVHQVRRPSRIHRYHSQVFCVMHMLQFCAVCCRVCSRMCCSVCCSDCIGIILRCFVLYACCSKLQCLAVKMLASSSGVLCYICCSVLQCIAVYCSVLQCVAVCCSALQWSQRHDPWIFCFICMLQYIVVL